MEDVRTLTQDLDQLSDGMLAMRYLYFLHDLMSGAAISLERSSSNKVKDDGRWIRQLHRMANREASGNAELQKSFSKIKNLTMCSKGLRKELALVDCLIILAWERAYYDKIKRDFFKDTKPDDTRLITLNDVIIASIEKCQSGLISDFTETLPDAIATERQFTLILSESRETLTKAIALRLALEERETIPEAKEGPIVSVNCERTRCKRWLRHILPEDQIP